MTHKTLITSNLKSTNICCVLSLCINMNQVDKKMLLDKVSIKLLDHSDCTDTSITMDTLDNNTDINTIISTTHSNSLTKSCTVSDLRFKCFKTQVVISAL